MKRRKGDGQRPFAIRVILYRGDHDGASTTRPLSTVSRTSREREGAKFRADFCPVRQMKPHLDG